MTRRQLPQNTSASETPGGDLRLGPAAPSFPVCETRKEHCLVSVGSAVQGLCSVHTSLRPFETSSFPSLKESTQPAGRPCLRRRRPPRPSPALGRGGFLLSLRRLGGSLLIIPSPEGLASLGPSVSVTPGARGFKLTEHISQSRSVRREGGGGARRERSPLKAGFGAAPRGLQGWT